MCNGTDAEWELTIQMHFMGDVDTRRVCRVVKDLPGCYNVYFEGRRCAYLVEIDFYNEDDAKNVMRLSRFRDPPPPPAPAVGGLVLADAQVQGPQTQQANRHQEWW